jgi:hypothetical protein
MTLLSRRDSSYDMEPILLPRGAQCFARVSVGSLHYDAWRRCSSFLQMEGSTVDPLDFVGFVVFSKNRVYPRERLEPRI